VIDIFADVMIERGIQSYIRNDNGPEMIAKCLHSWQSKVGAKTLYIEPGSPWENGFGVVIEQWRQHYNRVRPHRARGYRPPAPEARGLALSPRQSVLYQRAL